MSLGRALAVALLGVDGHLVEVEAHLAAGLPGCTLVGLPDAAVHEARDRVRAALVNSGEAWPGQRITIGLSPAGLRKSGSMFDLAMAVALLAATGAVPAAAVRGGVFLGELGLDGRLRAVPGILPAALAAARVGIGWVAVPQDSAAEAALVPGLTVRAAPDLAAALAQLRGTAAPPPVPRPVPRPPAARPDLADVVGQTEARRGLEIAAAGGHHLFLAGPPGVGKTLLAERLPGLLPPLTVREALEVTAVHSLAGALPAGQPVVSWPPFQSPHHSASVAALIGGGSGLARPGALSLAHRGVLFLDEAPEFPARTLEALRQPLEAGEVVLSRTHGVVRLPARVTLVLAANPCPCGVAGTADAARCECTPTARRRYLTRLSGPLLDRVDLRLRLVQVSRADLLADRRLAEPTATVATRVRAARERTAHRLRATPWRTNAEIPGPVLRRQWPVEPAALRPVYEAQGRGRLSARGVDRVLRVAWTLADLAGRPAPTLDHVHEALGYRVGPT